MILVFLGSLERNRPEHKTLNPTSRLLPTKIQFLMRSRAITQIEVNKTLIRNANFFRY